MKPLKLRTKCWEKWELPVFNKRCPFQPSMAICAVHLQMLWIPKVMRLSIMRSCADLVLALPTQSRAVVEGQTQATDGAGTPK